MLQETSVRDVQLLAVSTDSRTDSLKMIQGMKETYNVDVTFPLLADIDHAVIDRYGLRNMETAPGPRTRRYATPATLIIDKGGVVRWRMVEENWKLRPTNEVILAALRLVQQGLDASSVTLASVSEEADPLPEPLTGLPGVEASLNGMVLIPAGAFTMGAGKRDESLPHEVQLDAYYIDAREVTNRQYRVFLQAIQSSGDHRRCHPAEAPQKDHTPRYWDDARYNGEDLPVVGVDWFDAYAYAAWHGKRLPTEAEWERAARGGLEGKDYPWGDDVDETQANINHRVGADGAVLADEGKLEPASRQYGPTAVGSYAPNGFGLYDMLGNVEEWCLDWYDSAYYQTSPRANPVGPAFGTFKVVRGASWHHGKGRNHTRYTHTPDERAVFLGFRCVRPAAERPVEAKAGARGRE